MLRGRSRLRDRGEARLMPPDVFSYGFLAGMAQVGLLLLAYYWGRHDGAENWGRP